MTFSRKPVLATIQAKGTGPQQPRRIPPAPTPYRPQPVSKVLQTKLSASHQPLNQQTRTPVAPPVYRPQLNKFAQPKMAATAQSHKTPTAPPVYQPNSPMQLKPAKSPAHRPALAVSPFRPAQAKVKQSGIRNTAEGAIQPRVAGGRIPIVVQSPVQPPRVAAPARTATGTPVGGVIQRALDANVVTHQKIKANLSNELKAGLALAQAHPGALAANHVPGWVATRVDKWVGEHANDIDNDVTPNIRAAWIRSEVALGLRALNLNVAPTEDQKKDVKAAVEAAVLNDPKKTELANYIAAKLPNARTTWRNGAVTSRKNELKNSHWNVAFANNDGLPGTKGAGGYKEYYAEMDQTTQTTGGHKFWGKNRIVHNVSGLTNANILTDPTDVQYADKWYASDDHYITFSLITDA